MTIKRMANPSENSPARLHRGFSPYHRGFSPDHRDLILSSWARARGCEGEGSKNLRAACTLRDKSASLVFQTLFIFCSVRPPHAFNSRGRDVLECHPEHNFARNRAVHPGRSLGSRNRRMPGTQALDRDAPRFLGIHTIRGSDAHRRPGM